MNLVLQTATDTSVPQITSPSTGAEEASLGGTNSSGNPSPPAFPVWPISEDGTPGTLLPPGVPKLTFDKWTY